jgi:hypothetical protein
MLVQSIDSKFSGLLLVFDLLSSVFYQPHEVALVELSRCDNIVDALRRLAAINHRSLVTQTCSQHGLNEIADIAEDNPEALHTRIAILGLHPFDLNALHHRVLYDAAIWLENAPTTKLDLLYIYV